MDIIRPYIKEHNQELLEAVNSRLVQDMWNKYCRGNISSWEMDAISCYIHEHELAHLRNDAYGFVDYKKLPEEPEVNYEFRSKQTGKKVPLFKIHRIAGTVLDKDKAKKSVTLLTSTGVVKSIFSCVIESRFNPITSSTALSIIADACFNKSISR